MEIFDLFSKRQRRLRGDVPDVYVYDDLPQELRTQIVYIWDDALGDDSQYFDINVREAYSLIVNILCREYGLFKLPSGLKTYSHRNYKKELVDFLFFEQNIERLLDAVELSFSLINRTTRSWSYLHRSNADEIADSSIDELNRRFKEHGIGFQYIDNEIIRIDSELIHSEVVKPALRLLNQQAYAGVQDEFMKAHDHYRHGNAKEALNECLKSFESMMKAICKKRDWTYKKDATAKQLIQVCMDKGLIPAYWQSQYASLSSLLESSIPTGRNKESGHGQGAETTTVPDYLVAYMLHMTASAIVFFGEAEAKLP